MSGDRPDFNRQVQIFNHFLQDQDLLGVFPAKIGLSG